MKIRTVTLNNFRATEHLKLALGSRLTLLMGENSSGKTTVLDALAIAFGAALTHLPGVTGITFRKRGDLRQHGNKLAPFARIEVTTSTGLQWERVKRRDKSRRTDQQVPRGVGLKALEAFLNEQVIDPFNEGLEFQLPVFVLYGVGRALLDLPLSRKGFAELNSRLLALDKALLADSRFKSAFVWFYNKEIEELKLQKEQRSFDITLPALDVVRRAMTSMFPDLTDPHIEVSPLRFMVKKSGELLDIAHLSDGYKTLLGLVVDLASRMAMANPHLPDPLSVEAVVMIDEIDLHLHPAWQAHVIGDLLRTFPNAQFVITTHSPIIVEAINNHLKRHKIAALMPSGHDLVALQALNPADVAAYLMTPEGGEPLLNQEYGLLDDRLLATFNQVNAAYDQMRDMEWQAQ